MACGVPSRAEHSVSSVNPRWPHWLQGAAYIRINPRRSPRVTASVRLDAVSFPITDATWNFTVCSEIANFHAISLLAAPS